MTDATFDEAAIKAASSSLNNAFKDLKIDANVESCLIKGPLNRFRVSLGSGVKIKKLDGFSQEIAMALRAAAPPLIMPHRVDGVLDGTVRVDVMTGDHPIVPFSALAKGIGFDDPRVREQHQIPILLGVKDIDKPLVIDLQSCPHLLISGVTGSGKSVMEHTIIQSCIMHSEEQGIRLALGDIKGGVEFGLYTGSKALRYSVATDTESLLEIVEDLTNTMNERLARFAKHRCRNILEYRDLGKSMPYIVFVVDEMADAIRDKKSGFEEKFCSLAEKCRAAGIHIVGATQHPSSTVIKGSLKAQFPVRISCKVSSQVHSRVVLDENGAEKLMGKGDALLMDGKGDLQRFKGAFVDVSKINTRNRKRIANAKKKKKKARKKKKASPPKGLAEFLAELAGQFLDKKA